MACRPGWRQAVGAHGPKLSALAARDLGKLAACDLPLLMESVTSAAPAAARRSPHILANTGRVLATVLKTPDEEVDEYLQVLAEMAEASGGGIADPPQTVGDCPDWEDNRILDLAAAVGAFLIVSADTDLTSMSPWRGRPIIEPPQFASLVDAARRARRRRR